MNNLRSIIALLSLGVFMLYSCNFGTTKESKAEKNKAVVTTLGDYTQIATGQVTTYGEDGNVITDLKKGDSLFGQDANYLKGKKMSFKKNGDGTVTDLNTGLMWQEIPTEEGFDWQSAKEYCENLELGGYDDWRMPTAKELFSISDFSSGWPYIDLNYFSLVNNTNIDKSEQYWSSNKYVGHTEEGGYNAAFGVNYATGHIKAYPAAAPKKGKKAKCPTSKTVPHPQMETENLTETQC